MKTTIQLLTLAPQSWLIPKASATFEVTEYKAIKGKKLFVEKEL